MKPAGNGFVAESALLPDGWARDVRILWDSDGIIRDVSRDTSETESHAGLPRISGPVVPGMPNLHSHAFQRALVGLTQHPDPGADFWSWRSGMYRLAGRMEAQSLRAVSAWLFAELVAAGYTSVVEFHYLHRPSGMPALESSMAVVHAAAEAGIRLTLAPVLYRHGGFGKAVEDGQKPFQLSLDEYASLVESLGGDSNPTNPMVRHALAPHSLRAVNQEDLRFVAGLAGAHTPIHMHISEQPAEVRDALDWLGETPIRWLDQVVNLDNRWALVHATHADPQERALLAARGVTTVLCPTTEHDLGDGRYPLESFPGIWGVGSDSQVSVSPCEELRLLLYGMRAAMGRRAVLETSRVADGTALWQRAAQGKKAVTGHPVGVIDHGYAADLLVLDSTAPLFAGLDPDQALTAFVLSGQATDLEQVMVGGRVVARGGHHVNRERLGRDWARAVSGLRGRAGR